MVKANFPPNRVDSCRKTHSPELKETRWHKAEANCYNCYLALRQKNTNKSQTPKCLDCDWNWIYAGRQGEGGDTAHNQVFISKTRGIIELWGI